MADAMSRAENILKSMLGQSVTIQKPQSRIEELLLELKDTISGIGDVPELIQRISEAEESIEAIRTIIADNYVKRIVSKKTGLNEKAYIKIAEIKTGSSNIERITFIIAGLSNYGVSDIPVILATINERIGESEAAGQHSHARMLSAASTNLYKIGLVHRDDNVTEVWCGSESGFNGNADILVLNKGANTILFYDVQQPDAPEGFTEVPIETVMSSSDLATTEEVNEMINEVFGDAEFIKTK